MLDDIRFTIAAVAKKAFVQELTHFRIKGGRITGFDGRMTLSSSIECDLDVRPNAAKFLAAVRACEGTISLHVTPAGKLAVRAGKFRVYVECLPDDGAFESEPQGEFVELGEGFYDGIRALAPLMGVDASRPWAMGIKASHEYLFATNNVMVGQWWHASAFPYDVVIPARAVEELLRIGTAPQRVQVCETSVTFWFSESRWLKTNLIDGTQWPQAKLSELMDRLAGAQPVDLPENFAKELETLKPFLAEDGAVYVRPGSLSTSRDDGEGATVELPLEGPQDLQCYGFAQLTLLAQVSTAVDWASYPKPCMFGRAGAPLRGLIVGKVL